MPVTMRDAPRSGSDQINGALNKFHVVDLSPGGRTLPCLNSADVILRVVSVSWGQAVPVDSRPS